LQTVISTSTATRPHGRRVFAFWLGITVAATIGTAALGGVLALVVRKISWEYLVVLRNLPYADLYLNWAAVVPYGVARGARLGLVIATLVAAAAVVGRRRVPGCREMIAPGLAVLMCALLGSALGGLLAYAASRLGWVSFQPAIGRQVGHVYRVWCSYGVECGAATGSLGGALAAAVYVFRQRGRLCPPK